MKGIIKNWKTTLTGIATIVISLLTTRGKIDGATAAAITGGIGLILARDSKSIPEIK